MQSTSKYCSYSQAVEREREREREIKREGGREREVKREEGRERGREAKKGHGCGREREGRDLPFSRMVQVRSLMALGRDRGS